MRHGADGSESIRRRGVRLRHQVMAPRASQILPASPASTYVPCSCCRRDQTRLQFQHHDRHDRDRQNRHLGAVRQIRFRYRRLHQRLHQHPDVRHLDDPDHLDDRLDDRQHHLHRHPVGVALGVGCYPDSGECPCPGLMRTGYCPDEVGVEYPCPGSMRTGCCPDEVHLASLRLALQHLASQRPASELHLA